MRKYGMRFTSIRYFAQEGANLRAMTGWPFYSRMAGHLMHRSAQEVAGMWFDALQDIDSRTVAHAAIRYAAACTPEQLKVILGEGA